MATSGKTINICCSEGFEAVTAVMAAETQARTEKVITFCLFSIFLL